MNLMQNFEGKSAGNIPAGYPKGMPFHPQRHPPGFQFPGKQEPMLGQPTCMPHSGHQQRGQGEQGQQQQ